MKLSTIASRSPGRTGVQFMLSVAVLLSVIISLTLAEIVQASERESVLERIDQATKPYDSTTIDTVQPLSAKTVQARERYQGGTFRVLARKDNIGRYSCSSCHTNTQQTLARSGAVLTHGDIQLRHGKADSLSCIDCHHETERDYLEDKKGNKIDFDHSYQLCGQCHFRQKSDWLGGAHGKRAEYWAGERVVYNCTTCHNPHSPKFAKRFPATYSPPAK